MAKTITFRFEPGDEVFYATFSGICKDIVTSANYHTHTEKLVYRLTNMSMDEENLFESVKDLRKNLKYIGDD